jgi:site-specific recombinase XerD
MSEELFGKLFGKASDVVLHTIAPYSVERQQFLEHCRAQGFATKYLKRMAGVLLTAAVDLREHGGLEVDQASLEAVAARVEKIRSGAGSASGARGYSRVFVRVTTRWLLFAGRLREPGPRPRPYAALLDDFAQWMGEECGLSSRTQTGRGWHLGKFLDWLHDRGRRVSDLGLRDLDAYVQQLHAKGLSRVTIRIHVDAIRAFVRHAERREWCASGLADALHGPRIYREHGLPRGPSWDEVCRLIEDAASGDPVDVRDRAILLLFAVYGLRAGEVADLRLEDIDWERDRLTVRRSKAGRCQVYPVEPVVGQAIVRYLSEARPQSSLRELFLKHIAPIGPMTSTSLYQVVAHRMKRLGIQASRRGPHALRHACAGRLLARGLSLKEVGDHLGHRSPDTTRIYAKVDLQGLREVAAFDLGGLA